jgi:glycosyltransferase involved in cell wall biosynthesis
VIELMTTPSGRNVRIHFVNENIGGHATMHAHIRTVLASAHDIEATFYDVPPRHGLERAAGVSIPGLASLDIDFQPLRAQLARSAVVHRHLSELPGDPDALHIYTHNAALLSVEHMSRVPAVVSLDATNRQNAYRIPGRTPTRLTPLTVAATVPFERRVYRAARRVVAHSRWAADSVLGYGVPAANIEVVPFGIELQPKPPSRPERERPRILFVGTSMRRKGGWRLVEIWKRHLSTETDLTLVTREHISPGTGIEVRNDIRQGDGKIEEALAAADILAMPSEIDSFGYAALEAMAAALPVVAPAQGALPELIVDGSTGVLVRPGDDAAFAQALLELTRDGDQRRALGAAARERVEESFDARKTTARLIEIIRASAAA